jgi:hypothetical protein
VHHEVMKPGSISHFSGVGARLDTDWRLEASTGNSNFLPRCHFPDYVT